MFYKKSLFILILFVATATFSQQKERKSIKAIRVSIPPKIDGNINDDAWQNVETAKDFIIFTPDNGKPVTKEYATEVKVVYDDNAIYISAKLLDPESDKIPKQFSTRDNRGQADFFSVMINPNDDGQNPFQFIVEASGNQLDAKISSGNEDFNWSAVWDSDVKITDYGWNVEMKLPYRTLRFSNQPVQSWGFNFHRRLERLNTQHSWNYIDNAVGNWTQYDGLVTDIKNISPPTRLNLYPYASAITQTFGNKTKFDWNVGMDIKYGISENFTLDATLIPDFSQAGFDDVTLNLGPFEQQFTEQRQFFTEGTELFTKGDLFYSRRIGGRPIKRASTNDNETIIENPKKVNMLNAIKLSGRTKGGLGIGIFNAITEKTEAKIRNNTTNEVRTEVTNPFSNYNIAVVDYQFNQNSAVTLINTNVWRDGNFRDANATGVLWHIEDKTSTYNIDGAFKITHLSDVQKPTTGYNFDTRIGKHAGNWFWGIGYNFEDKNYNSNDLGILFSNNQQFLYGDIGYRILKPKGMFNRYEIGFRNNLEFLHHSGVYTGYSAALSFRAQTRKRFSFGINLNYGTPRKDFFEPRQGSLSGVYFKRNETINFSSWISTNYQKKFATDFSFYQTLHSAEEKHSYGFRLRPRYRFNNRLSFIYGFNFRHTNKDRGYVDEQNQTILFGQRNRTSYNNTLTAKYNFTVKSAVSLSFRHNWTTVLYNKHYFALQQNGSLKPTNYAGVNNLNFNSWNLDLNYQWQFAQGSQLIALYRNSINPDNNFASANLSFFNNIDALLNEKMQHIFSLRLVYFLDYNTLKSIF